jgi:hypothetical protein
MGIIMPYNRAKGGINSKFDLHPKIGDHKSKAVNRYVISEKSHAYVLFPTWYRYILENPSAVPVCCHLFGAEESVWFHDVSNQSVI